MRKLEIRAGMKGERFALNEVVGRFEGPGKTGGHHIVQFEKPVVAQFLAFQLKMKKGILQINGIRLNEKPIKQRELPQIRICSLLHF